MIPGSLVLLWGPWLWKHICCGSWPLFAEVTWGGQWPPVWEGLSWGFSKPQLQEVTADASSIFRSWCIARGASDLEEPIIPPVCFWLPHFPSLFYQNLPLSMGLGWNDPELTELGSGLWTQILMFHVPPKTVATKIHFKRNIKDYMLHQGLQIFHHAFLIVKRFWTHACFACVFIHKYYMCTFIIICVPVIKLM